MENEMLNPNAEGLTRWVPAFQELLLARAARLYEGIQGMNSDAATRRIADELANIYADGIDRGIDLAY